MNLKAMMESYQSLGDSAEPEMKNALANVILSRISLIHGRAYRATGQIREISHNGATHDQMVYQDLRLQFSNPKYLAVVQECAQHLESQGEKGAVKQLESMVFPYVVT